VHKIVKAILLLCICMSPAYGKVVVFWQEGFPTLESQPVPQETLQRALDGLQPECDSCLRHLPAGGVDARALKHSCGQ
jgi:hypothetical protein